MVLCRPQPLANISQQAPEFSGSYRWYEMNTGPLSRDLGYLSVKVFKLIIKVLFAFDLDM